MCLFARSTYHLHTIFYYLLLSFTLTFTTFLLSVSFVLPFFLYYARSFGTQGMHKGAIGMLDYYGLRESLVTLATRGYVITVVGHSLGAGTVV